MKKWMVSLLTSALVLQIGFQTQAESQQSQQSSSQTSQQHANKITEILGKDVKNTQNEKLGKIEDLAVDLESGQIKYAILAVDRAMNMGDRRVAVPLKSLQRQQGAKELTLAVTKAQLNTAPNFDKDHPPAQASTSWVQSSQATGGSTAGETGKSSESEHDSSHKSDSPSSSSSSPSTSD